MMVQGHIICERTVTELLKDMLNAYRHKTRTVNKTGQQGHV